MGIYVEILIRAPMETLWAHTQTPELHQRWDLRFSRIDYLPRESETEPQRFRYATRIGFGVEVVGEGESLGERDLATKARLASRFRCFLAASRTCASGMTRRRFASASSSAYITRLGARCSAIVGASM
jgi:hypothetical protein